MLAFKKSRILEYVRASFPLVLAVGVCAVFLFVGAGSAFAQTENFGLESDFQNVGVQTERTPTELAALIINIALGFLGIIAVSLIIYAGFIWLTAGGNTERVAQAKKIIINAVIGLVIVFSSWVIASFIIKSLGGGAGSGSGISVPGSPGGGGGLLPQDRFVLQEFQTAHGARADGKKFNNENVYLCSTVQARFNHWLLQSGFATARGQGSLSVIQTIDNGQTIDARQVPVDTDLRNNVVRFAKAGEADDWSPNSTYKIQAPKSLVDASNRALADCTAFGCVAETDKFVWAFKTGTETDEIKPALNSSYPAQPFSSAALAGENPAAQFDRSVDRSAILSFNFSEGIDVFSLLDENGLLKRDALRLEMVNYAGGTLGSGDMERLPVLSAVPAASYDVTVTNTGFLIALNQNHSSAAGDGPYYEPFAWYRITLANIQDLCGNAMAPIEPWLFRTNGNLPGVSFVYPQNNFAHACPNTEAFVQFRTSMYDIKNSSCAVTGNTATGGLVKSGQGIDNRSLLAADPPPLPVEGGPAINPNDFCRKYEFATAANLLNVNSEYSPSVSYMNAALGSLASEAWKFSVKPADQCANAPYITALSPTEGSWGRCLTMVGRNFGAAGTAYAKVSATQGGLPAGGGDYWQNGWQNDKSFFSIADSAACPGGGTDCWQNTAVPAALANLDEYKIETGEFAARLAAAMPDAAQNAVGLDVFVEIPAPASILAAVPGGMLASNISPFMVFRDEDSYRGPCLSALSPSAGDRGTTVTVSGSRFRSGFDRVGNTTIRQTYLGAAEAPIYNWTSTNDSSIQLTIPTNGADGLIRARTVYGYSNGLPFDVRVAAGESCSAGGAAPLCSPDPNLCSTGYVCGAGCICQSIQDTSFRINSWQYSAPVREVSIKASLPINPSSLSLATYDANGNRSGGSIGLRQCESDKQKLYDFCRRNLAPLLETQNPAPAINTPERDQYCAQSFTNTIQQACVLSASAGITASLAGLEEGGSRQTLLINEGQLAEGQRYRAFVYGGSAGVLSSTGKTIENVNFDSDRDAVRDAYSFTFTAGQNASGGDDPSVPLDPVLPPSPKSINLTVETFYPNGDSVGRACQNTIPSAIVKGYIKSSTVSADTVKLYQGDALVAGSVRINYEGDSKTRISFVPDSAFAIGSSYKLEIKGGNNGIRSSTDGILAAETGSACKTNFSGDNCFHNFTVNTSAADAACQPVSLTVLPQNQVYFSAAENRDGDESTAPGHQRHYNAAAKPARGDTEIVNPGAVAWRSSQSNVIAFVENTSDTHGLFRINPQNGETVISARAGSLHASSTAEVFLCENPWTGGQTGPFGEPFVERITNFSTFYCRDSASGEDLPALEVKPTTPQDGALYEAFFINRINANRSDAIGIRVLSNLEHYSPSRWYAAREFGGNPQSVKVDDYDALQEGRTIYAVAPNLKNNNALYSNVYVISHTNEPASETLAIFNQMVENWKFAVNIADSSERASVRRDLRRVLDLAAAGSLIEGRGAPTLLSGSFEPGVSTSVWPSWGGALAADLRSSLPSDPINALDTAACQAAGADIGTCLLNQNFRCAFGHRVYYYKKGSSGNSFALRANLEYKPSENLWQHANGAGFSFAVDNTCGRLGYTR